MRQSRRARRPDDSLRDFAEPSQSTTGYGWFWIFGNEPNGYKAQRHRQA
jgi:hypothetical protein